MATFIQPSFAKGEIGPALYGRVDTAAYQVALRTARNITIHTHGGASNRPGTKFICPVKTHTAEPILVDFQFKATMMNTDRQAMAEGMLQMAGLILSPLAIQMGIVDRSSVFRFYQDVFKIQELDAERYIVPPSKEDTRQRLSFRDAMDLIVRGIPPQGVPLEQPQVHLEKLILFRESEAFGSIPEEFIGLFAFWASEVQRMAQEQQALQQQAQAAAQGQQQSQEPQEDGREAAPQQEQAVQADPAGPNDAQGL